MPVILIVEDEPKNMKLFRDLLRATGYTTLEATNGEEGLAAARAGKPDLILMDIQMPVMDGLKATGILKSESETANIPIVALTALAMDGDGERVLQAGCDGYVTKPIQVKDFLTRVADFLTKSG